jgi:cytoskeletal protein CcmA (bactofilin family)
MQVNMFFRSNKAAEAAALAGQQSAGIRRIIPSLISADLHILGNIISDGLVDIDGSIEGNVKAGQVTIRVNGSVSGDVIAETVHVYGKVRGLIRAQTVYLYSSCHIEGVVMYKSMTMEDGAFVDGKCKRIQDKVITSADTHTVPRLEMSDIIDDDSDSEPMGSNLRLIS